MKKLSVIAIILLIFCGCAGTGNIEDTTLPVEADELSEVTDEVAAGSEDDLNVESYGLASDYILSDADSYKIYLGEYLFAYITTDNRVFYVTDYGSGALSGGYIPDIDNASAIIGSGWQIMVLDDAGNISGYDALTEEPLSLERLGFCFFDELDEYNVGIEDIFYSAEKCWAVRRDGVWYYSPSLEWVDWSKVTQLVSDGSGSGPEMALYSDGKVYLNTIDPPGDEALFSTTKSWSNVAHIAEGLAPFGLTGDGRLLTASNSAQLASDINNWSDITQISALCYITAGLKKDGTVLVETYEQWRNFENAEEWTDVRYIQVTPFYIFGITCDGRFLFTEDEVNESIVRWLGRNEYPCSMLAACYMTDSELDIINSDNIIKPEVVTELSFGDGDIDMASFAKADDVITYTGDFDGDGAEDTLTVDYSAMVNDTQGIGNIYVTSAGGTEYWRDMFALPSAGWTSFYVTEIDGRSYVIRYYPPMSMQGLLYYTCQIFTFDTDGNMVYYDEFGGVSDSGVNAFSDKAGKYLSNAVHLVSTFDGKLITY